MVGFLKELTILTKKIYQTKSQWVMVWHRNQRRGIYYDADRPFGPADWFSTTERRRRSADRTLLGRSTIFAAND